MSDRTRNSSSIAVKAPGIDVWKVQDPAGLEHTVFKDKLGYDGTVNLGHTIADIRQRPYIVSRLLLQIDREPAGGEWEGWSWLKL